MDETHLLILSGIFYLLFGFSSGMITVLIINFIYTRNENQSAFLSLKNKISNPLAKSKIQKKNKPKAITEEELWKREQEKNGG